jgi:hypothetical protein
VTADGEFGGGGEVDVLLEFEGVGGPVEVAEEVADAVEEGALGGAADLEGVGCCGDLVGVCWESGVDAEGDDFALGVAGGGGFQAEAGAAFELFGEDGGGGRGRADDDGVGEIDGVEGGGQEEGECEA